MSSSKYPYIARGNQRYTVLRSQTFNIDNGSGTTVDECLAANLPTDAELVSVQAIYQEATDTAGAADANFSLGTTAGGDDIVAATALEASKAVGAYTSATLAATRLAAGNSLFARHTGIAATEAGQYSLQVILMLEP